MKHLRCDYSDSDNELEQGNMENDGFEIDNPDSQSQPIPASGGEPDPGPSSVHLTLNPKGIVHILS